MSSVPQDNHLLASFSPAEFALLGPHLRRTVLPLGKTLYESGHPVDRAYFPTTAIVSLHYARRRFGGSRRRGERRHARLFSGAGR